MIGKFLVYAFFTTALLSSISYYITHLGKEKYLKAGRLFFHLTAIGILSTAAFLMYAILTHQYQFAYVWIIIFIILGRAGRQLYVMDCDDSHNRNFPSELCFKRRQA